MVTSDLIEYIKKQQAKNISNEIITSRLAQAGWKQEDIEDGLKRSKLLIPITSLPNQTEIKRETLIELPKVEEINFEEENKPIEEKPAEIISVVEAPKEELPPIIPRVDIPKVEVASSATRREGVEIKIETPVEVKPVENLPSSFLSVPILNKNSAPESVIKVTPPVIPEQKPISIKLASLNPMSDVIPKTAMISSFGRAMSSALEEKEPVSIKKKHPYVKWIIITIVAIFVFGMIFAFVEGYIKIPGSSSSFFVVKKDPKVIMQKAPTTISNLKSFKTETTINISSPALSNITTGLSSGTVVSSRERDSITINVKGKVNHISDNLIFDYLLNFKSSILKNDIISNIKYDGSYLSVSIPSLNEILGRDAPAVVDISLAPNQLNLIVPEFSIINQEKIKKIDMYNMLGDGIPPYVRGQISSIFKDFITSLQYVSKGEEKIHGVDTYHYELTADRAFTKKFLVALSDLLIAKLPDNQKKNLDEAIGSSVFNSIEVWVGKNDDNLYQFKFTLNAPLSRVLGLNDSGIAGNEVILDWKTTYYDIDVTNNIIFDKNETDISDFIKRIKDQKIKNIIDNFKPQATLFKNAIGSYGARTNPAGSCTNPNLGSLFSPLGHPKGAGTAIAVISSSMNSLLLATNGLGSCFSSSKEWALSVPISIDPNPSAPNPTPFYCADSIGNVLTLAAPITGTICK